MSHIAFDGLLQELKKEGFTVQVHDYMEFAAIFDGFTGLREDLKYYLAPIICRNKEEQERFYRIYDEHQRQDAGSTGLVPAPAEKRKGLSLFQKILVFVLAPFALAGSIYIRIAFFLLVSGILKSIDMYRHRHHTETEVPAAKAPDNFAPDTATARKAPPKQDGPVFVAKPYKKGSGKDEEKSSITPIGPSVVKENNVRSVTFGWLVVAGLALLGASMSFFPQRRSRYLPETDLDQYNGEDDPKEIPYLSKDDLIQKLSVLSRLSGDLIRTVPTGVYKLDIGQTIAETIQAYGMVSPVYAEVERRPEYLVLADKKYELLYHLFRYLTRVFIGDKVNIHYYFFQDTEFFYPGGGGNAASFYSLRERHSHAKLITMGDGHSFIDAGKGKLREGLAAEFGYWEDRIILTPVPLSEWGYSELLLATHFRMVSADIENSLHLVEHLAGKQPGLWWPAEGRRKKVNSMLREQFDMDALTAYLEDEDLLQWVCAAAICPTVRWEVLIATGAVLLESRQALHKLNFSNLLAIARIGWMKGGVIPDEIRLELLKRLDTESEVLVRKHLLGLLKECDPLVTEKSFCYKEKLLQTYTQSFVLFANDTKKYKQYEEDARRFMSLLDKRQVPDGVTVAYLKNADRAWMTPIRSIDDKSKNAGAERFMDELLAFRVIANPRIRMVLRNAGMACLMLLGSIYLFKDTLQEFAAVRSMHVIESDYGRNDIVVRLAVNDCVRQLADSKGVLKLTLNNYDNNRYTQSVSLTGKDSIVCRFADITMGGKAPEKATFQLIAGTGEVIDCPYQEYYPLYSLYIPGSDCSGTIFRPGPPNYYPRSGNSLHQ